MENADKRNVTAPTSNVNFSGRGVFPVGVTCRTAKLNAANVPGYEALMIGFMNFSSNSSII